MPIDIIGKNQQLDLDAWMPGTQVGKVIENFPVARIMNGCKPWNVLSLDVHLELQAGQLPVSERCIRVRPVKVGKKVGQSRIGASRRSVNALRSD